jgi:hypothetical protein
VGVTRVIGLITLLASTALVTAATALAQDTQPGGYPGGGIGGDVEGRLGTSAGGTLPFTGLNLVLLVVGGAVLIALGTLIVLRGRSGDSAA